MGFWPNPDPRLAHYRLQQRPDRNDLLARQISGNLEIPSPLFPHLRQFFLQCRKLFLDLT